MSQKKQSRRSAPPPVLAPDKPRRVYLRNYLYIFLTILAIIATIALMVSFELLGWWDNFIGSILVFVPGVFACLCLYDLGLLFSACVTFGGGMVNAGKSASGERMVFHASAVVRLELRDTEGRVLTENTSVYKNIDLAFVMESGRVNLKRVSRLTGEQLARLRGQIAAEKMLDTH